MTDKDEAQGDMMAQFVTGLVKTKIPPPVKFAGDRGAISVGAFFVAFERFSTREYGVDPLSWMQVLPQYMEGEAREMVNAFDHEAKYEVVKQRMLEEFLHRQSLGNNETNDFFAARKRSEESWKCFAIRLDALAVKVASAAEGSRQVMVRSRFFRLCRQQLDDRWNCSWAIWRM